MWREVLFKYVVDERIYFKPNYLLLNLTKYVCHIKKTNSNREQKRKLQGNLL